jgi:phosphoribosylanthranilate isomerase
VNTVQIKICGLTLPDQAAAVAAAGADAIGLVFYPPSKRNVSDAQARELVAAIGDLPAVGVFVNEPADEIIRRVSEIGLSYAQLHGSEDVAYIQQLEAGGVRVIQTLTTTGEQLLADAKASPCETFLVEAGEGPLPGGNGAGWNWADAAPLAGRYPFVLAGGLNADTVGDAILASGCDAVDISSGVEIAPGDKDLEKVRAFIEAARSVAPTRAVTPVF